MSQEKIVFHSGVLKETENGFIQPAGLCPQCGKTSFPLPERCMYCAGEGLEEVSLSREGIVFSYSITRVPVGPFAPPLVGAYIDLPEGVRIFAQIIASEDQIKTGMRVKMETGPLWKEADGTDVFGYFYRPAGEGGAE